MSRKLQLLTGFSVISLVLAVSLSIIALSPANAAPGDFDLDGRDLILDADGDTIIDSNSDDSINFTVGGNSTLNPYIADSAISKIVRTTSDTTRIDTTLQDSALTFTVSANTAYQVKYTLIMSEAGGTPNGQVNITVPASASFAGLGCGGTWEIVGSPPPYCQHFTSSASEAISIDGSGILETFTIIGMVEIAGTAGSVTFQWAQNVTDAANPITLHENSTVEYTRVE